MTSTQTQPRFLPITPAECAALGWTEIDILLISGDAYVDHPSFGAAVVGASGMASFGYALPNNPALSGASVGLQALGTAPTAAGLGVSPLQGFGVN